MDDFACIASNRDRVRDILEDMLKIVGYFYSNYTRIEYFGILNIVKR